ncbi:MAG TPA: ABC transporter transmembrane domain-containing protein, partial [Bacilli bacterium]
LAIFLMVIVNILNIIPPKMIGDVIDLIRVGKLTGEALTQTVWLLIGLAVFIYVVTYIWITRLFGSSILLEKVLRSRLLSHLTRMSPSFFHRNRTGDIMALATNDILAIGNTAGYGVLTLVNTVIGTSVVLVTMITLIDYKLMLAALLPLPFLAYAINRLGKTMRKHFLTSQQAFGFMNDQALESISGMRVLRSYVQEDKDVQAFDKVTQDVMNKNIKVAYINSLFQPVISTIVGLSFSIGLGYGSYLVFNGQISLGQLVSFNIYLGLLIWPMISFGEFINILQRGSASADRLETNFIQNADVTDRDSLVDVKLPASIEIRDLAFSYPGSNNNSLEHISLRIEHGSTLGIVGRTGSGKTTLLKQFLRQYPVEDQKIIIDNVPIESIPLDRIKGWVGYVPQEHLLLSKTIKHNIALGKPEASVKEIEHVIEMAFFTNDIAGMPNGLETIIGENGVMLSGGQKQRISIARALLVDPEILMLDDALSAVDAKTESIILHNIRKTREGKTTLIATHRLSAVRHAQWIIVLDEGRIVEEGPHGTLMALDGWYAKQYIRQQMEASLLNGKEDSEDEV